MELRSQYNDYSCTEMVCIGALPLVGGMVKRFPKANTSIVVQYYIDSPAFHSYRCGIRVENEVGLYPITELHNDAIIDLLHYR